jgi:hypothetical protein
MTDGARQFLLGVEGRLQDAFTTLSLFTEDAEKARTALVDATRRFDKRMTDQVRQHAHLKADLDALTEARQALRDDVAAAAAVPSQTGSPLSPATVGKEDRVADLQRQVFGHSLVVGLRKYGRSRLWAAP